MNAPYDCTIENTFLSDEVDERTHSYLNESISVEEILKGLTKLKCNKARGFDSIPAEVIKNQRLQGALTVLFNRCFVSGVVPSAWKKGVIHPIPKSSTADKRDPLSYRGITVTSSLYNLYCVILNNRLVKWEEEYSVLNDAQNGFRTGRSTIDHISSLTSIIETRKLKKQSTYVGFIDFRKAYDSIDRNLMFRKLRDLGISGFICKSILSLYDNVECCVNVNGFFTDWFSVNCGLKQGCCLSTLFFNLYINDLVTMVNALNVGVDIGAEKVAVMLYADDLVLIAENEYELQMILDTVHEWCVKNRIHINQDKSNVIHFRGPSVQCTDFQFRCGERY